MVVLKTSDSGATSFNFTTPFEKLGAAFHLAATRILSSLGAVLIKGFDELPTTPITARHFLPWSDFVEARLAENSQQVAAYRDRCVSRVDYYCNDSNSLIRVKCLALLLGTPTVQVVKTLFNMANKIAKIVTFAHWRTEYDLKTKAFLFGKDLLILALSPIILVGLQLSALYGVISPHNGRKLYATLERLAFGQETLAPCFQPAYDENYEKAKAAYQEVSSSYGRTESYEEFVRVLNSTSQGWELTMAQKIKTKSGLDQNKLLPTPRALISQISHLCNGIGGF